MSNLNGVLKSTKESNLRIRQSFAFLPAQFWDYAIELENFICENFSKFRISLQNGAFSDTELNR